MHYSKYIVVILIIKKLVGQFTIVCGTVSSMLSGLKTMSLGLTHKAQRNLQPRHSLSKSVVRPPLPVFNQY